MALVVSGEPAAAADPSEGALDDPALREDDEAVPVAAADDLKLPEASAGDGGFHRLPLVAGVADDALDKGKAPPRLPEQRLRPVPVLHAGRVDVDGEPQAERVGQDVALAADPLLAGIVAGRIKRSPPLRAPFAVWLSRIAVVGLASRPAFSRTST